jgi:hypothetical protein
VFIQSDCPPNPAEETERRQKEERERLDRIKQEEENRRSEEENRKSPEEKFREQERLRQEYLDRKFKEDLKAMEEEARLRGQVTAAIAAANAKEAAAYPTKALTIAWNGRKGLPSQQTDLERKLIAVYQSRRDLEKFEASYLLGLVNLEMAEEWRLAGNLSRAATNLREAIRFLGASAIFAPQTPHLDGPFTSRSTRAKLLLERITGPGSPYQELLPFNLEAIRQESREMQKEYVRRPIEFSYFANEASYDLDARRADIRYMVEHAGQTPPEVLACILPPATGGQVIPEIQRYADHAVALFSQGNKKLADACLEFAMKGIRFDLILAEEHVAKALRVAPAYTKVGEPGKALNIYRALLDLQGELIAPGNNMALKPDGRVELYLGMAESQRALYQIDDAKKTANLAKKAENALNDIMKKDKSYKPTKRADELMSRIGRTKKP